MAIPLAPIALALAATGLKIYGGKSELIELLRHPIDLLAGHSAAQSLEDLGERFRTWSVGNQPPDNQDLARAVMRSSLFADLFCLGESLPDELGVDDSLLARGRLGGLFAEPPRGVFATADRRTIIEAIDSTKEALRAPERGDGQPFVVDLTQLVRLERDEDFDYAAALSSLALDRVESRHRTMPTSVQRSFRERWFYYLCLAFQEELKTNERLVRIFSLLQAATGFLNVERVVREEALLTREANRQQHHETLEHLREILEMLDGSVLAAPPPADDMRCRSMVRVRRVGDEAGVWKESTDRSAGIGRGPSNAFQVDDAEVSWEHAIILRIKDEWHYRHISDTNPSFIERRAQRIRLSAGKVTEIPLHNYDKITVGTTTLIVEFDLINDGRAYIETEKQPDE